MEIDCYKCKHRRDLPGSAHSKCVHPSIERVSNDPLTNVLGILASVGRELPFSLGGGEELNIKASPHGIKNGWFIFPVNFDPMWLLNCDGFTENESLEKGGGDKPARADARVGQGETQS